jgi:hypothetical protein
MRKTFTFLLASLLSYTSFSQSKGLHFDGINDYVTIPAKAGVLNGPAFTVETWIKPTSATFGSYLLRGTDDAYTSGVEIWVTNDYLEADLYSNGGGLGLVYSIPTSWTNQWHHLAVTYTSTTFSFFVDGVQVATTPISGFPQPFTGAPLYLGAYDAGSSPFPGTMDELRIWNTARTQAQIQANMNTEIPANTAGLVANYRMNQGTAGGNNTSITTLIDQVSPNYGTLMNFARTGTTSNFVTGYATITVLAMKNASFTAVRKGSTVQLDWKSTASEGPSLFTVERSSNGIDFSPIGTVAAPASTAEAAHSFTDRTPLSILAHYRIRSTDADGRVTYSKTLAVAGGKAVAGLQAYPNPASSIIQLQVTAPKGAVLIEVKDLGGRTVQAMQMASQGNAIYTTMDISNLAKGMYTVTAGNESTLLIKQ